MAASAIHKVALCFTPEDRFEGGECRGQIHQRRISQPWPLETDEWVMRQAIDIRRVPAAPRTRSGWLDRLQDWLFGPSERRKVAALRHCSRHLLRDIGLLDDRRANGLLRDDVMLRR